MPLFTYNCKECCKLFEVMVKLKDIDKNEPKCPYCEKKLEKLMDAPMFVIR